MQHFSFFVRQRGGLQRHFVWCRARRGVLLGRPEEGRSWQTWSSSGPGPFFFFFSLCMSVRVKERERGVHTLACRKNSVFTRNTWRVFGHVHIGVAARLSLKWEPIKRNLVGVFHKINHRRGVSVDILAHIKFYFAHLKWFVNFF